MDEIRKPAVAGQFYEASKKNLTESIKQCFIDKRGPGSIAEIKKGEKDVKGIVVPHAGLIYSGAIAAYSYKFLAENGFADTFIILGPNHTGFGSGVAVMTKGSWLTPLGNVEINEKIAKNLQRGIIDNDNTAHQYEHSIEVQLPFLQFIAKNQDFKFIPLSMGMQDIDTSIEVGKILAEEIKNYDKKVAIIASSDFSHAGFNYMSMPPKGLRVDEYAKNQDDFAIKAILDLNEKELINIVQEKNITMCGYGPVAAMITANKLLGAKKAELLKYGTSYEVHPSSSCVGYGAIAIY